jgi:secreted trypsin-like serine protease
LTARRLARPITFVVAALVALGSFAVVGRDAEAIVGGTQAAEGSFPWTVHVSSSVGSCAGSLYAPDIVLTAAHCVPPTGPTSGVQVRSGSVDLDNVCRGGPPPCVWPTGSRSVYRNPGYVTPDDTELGASIGDWALIKLQYPVDAPTLTIATDRSAHNGALTIMGWGLTKRYGGLETAYPSRRLMVTSTEFVDDETCDAYYANTRLKRIKPPEALMCGHPPYVPEDGDITTGRGNCTGTVQKGDSGGPVVKRLESGAYLQVGIVSWAVDCHWGSPDVYTEVATYAADIKAAALALT